MLPWGIGSTLVWQFSEKCDPTHTHTKQTCYKELPCNKQSLPECVPGETGAFVLESRLHLLGSCCAAVLLVPLWLQLHS